MQRIIRPYIGFNELEKELRRIFRDGILTKGRCVAGFRESLKEYTGARFSFLTSSATTALWICLKAVGIKQDDEVIVSDFSFPATANVVEDLGARPVFADVDPDTFNMLPQELEDKITGRTKAVIFVDAFGNPSGLTRIKEICVRRKIALIEDAACAMGSSIGASRCGNISDITCFSFHPRKIVTTGEGGAITTNSAKYAKFFEIKLNQGGVFRNGGWDFIDYGYNFRLSEIQALLGLKQIRKIDGIIRSRSRIKDDYARRLEPLGFSPQKAHKNVVHNIQSLVFKVPGNIKRDILIKYLSINGIESAIGTYCLSNTPYYRRKYGQLRSNSKHLQEHTITLPCFNEVKTGYICDIIKRFCAKPAR